MNKPEWINQENKQYRNMTEKRFAEYYIKHEHIWKDISKENKMKLSVGVRNRIVSEGMTMETITIDNWLRKMKKLAKGVKMSE